MKTEMSQASISSEEANVSAFFVLLAEVLFFRTAINQVTLSGFECFTSFRKCCAPFCLGRREDF